MSLNLSETNKGNKTPTKRKKDSQARDTFLGLFIFGLIAFIFGYKTWSKVLDKHVKY